MSSFFSEIIILQKKIKIYLQHLTSFSFFFFFGGQTSDLKAQREQNKTDANTLMSNTPRADPSR